MQRIDPQLALELGYEADLDVLKVSDAVKQVPFSKVRFPTIVFAYESACRLKNVVPEGVWPYVKRG